MSRRYRLPALSDLSGAGVMDFLRESIAPARLQSLGWNAGGGALAAIAEAGIVSRTAQLPYISAAPVEVHQAVVGFVGGSLLHVWQPEAAAGFVGKVSGDIAEALLTRFGLMQYLVPEAGMTAGLGAGAPDALAPLHTSVTVDPNQLGEVIQRGALGANVQQLRAQPTIQPTFDPQYQGSYTAFGGTRLGGFLG